MHVTELFSIMFHCFQFSPWRFFLSMSLFRPMSTTNYQPHEAERGRQWKSTLWTLHFQVGHSSKLVKYINAFCYTVCVEIMSMLAASREPSCFGANLFTMWANQCWEITIGKKPKTKTIRQILPWRKRAHISCQICISRLYIVWCCAAKETVQLENVRAARIIKNHKHKFAQ